MAEGREITLELGLALIDRISGLIDVEESHLALPVLGQRILIEADRLLFPLPGRSKLKAGPQSS